MGSATVGELRTGSAPGTERAGASRVLADLTVLVPALAAIALMVLWAAHDGGYDLDTWYWGALAMLALTVLSIGVHGLARVRSRPGALIALGCLAGYTAWSYLSIAWASAPGQALDGANRTLLYLLAFTAFLVLPWTARTALVALCAWVAGMGALVLTVLLRLATLHLVGASFSDGRLIAPTAYFNATAALFTMTALVAIGLAARRELPALARGALCAIACGGLQLAVLCQSRGWLFTLPLVALATIALVRERIRYAAAAVPALAGALVAVPRLLDIPGGLGSQAAPTAAALTAVRHAGHTGLLACAAVLIVATALAIVERVRPLAPGRRAARAVGVTLAVLALGGGVAGGLAATHGDPSGFVSRQWHGFTHQATAVGAGSHFSQVGSGRYDFWRVAWHATVTHPLGGLGQDNFGDYYVPRRRTYEEPRWTHSLWLRLLAHTGVVGLLLFAGFVVAAFVAGRAGAVLASIALLPAVVWLIHGSVDWFWEFPALSGPVFAFLGLAAALARGADAPAGRAPAAAPRAAWRVAGALLGAVLVLACTAALALPYLSVRYVSRATDEAAADPTAALRDLDRAGSLNPLNADPGRLAGALALLRTGDYREAEHRFREAIDREPGGWFAWFGDGLAASMLGDRARARQDLQRAMAINSRQPPISDALGRLDSPHPLTPAQALAGLTSET